MSYTPQILIKYEDLYKIKDELEEEIYSDDYDTEKVARILLEELKFPNLLPEFEGVKVILCTAAEFSETNRLVRERLCEGNVYYVTFV